MFKKILIPKSIALIIALAIILNVLRVVLFGKLSFVYLLWNIFLAFVPFLISSVLLYFKENGKLKNWLLIIGGIIWVLFLPNAPYIVTDLIHIGVVRSVPVLYDSVLLFTSAWAGLLLGLHSISHIEKIILSMYSKKVTSIIIAAVIFLSSFGMYLGRFLRFNTWDIFERPLSFAKGIVEIFTDEGNCIEALLYTVLFFFFILIFYNAWKYSSTK